MIEPRQRRLTPRQQAHARTHSTSSSTHRRTQGDIMCIGRGQSGPCHRDRWSAYAGQRLNMWCHPGVPCRCFSYSMYKTAGVSCQGQMSHPPFFSSFHSATYFLSFSFASLFCSFLCFFFCPNAPGCPSIFRCGPMPLLLTCNLVVTASAMALEWSDASMLNAIRTGSSACRALLCTTMVIVAGSVSQRDVA